MINLIKEVFYKRPIWNVSTEIGYAAIDIKL